MKPVLIIENSTNSLIRENNGSTKKDYILGGTFTEFGVKNRNERIYTAEKFLPALQELNERMSNLGVVYGEFDHPDVFDTSLSRASHIITKANYVKESNLVNGEIRLLNTYWGKEAKALVDDGCPVFVSSRAAGITESDGTVSLKKLFTYDIVADPGFASAKMSVKNINESLGYNENSNFRIYEMSDESKINQLFDMNKNEFVTKQQLTEYSQYLVKELASTKKEVKGALTKGNLSPKKLEQLLEYYEELNATNSQVVKYLDYLAEKVQIMVNENKSLKETTDKLIKHNDYLAENLEKAVNYSEYLAENLDKNIEYSEYLAENLDKNINYSEYIAENLDKNISYSEYLAENLDKNIEYSEYLAENLDKNIAYSEYIAENLDKNISYAEYIAEHVDNSIAYSEYLAEHVEGNIAYSEYIAEHLDDNIAYSEYIAENLDKSISYQGLIVEKLNSKKLNESMGEEEEAFPSLQAAGFENTQEDEDCGPNAEENDEEEAYNGIAPAHEEEAYNKEEDEDCGPSATEEENNDEEEAHDYEVKGVSDSELSESINKLIEEAKKRKVSESSDLNFLKFLNKSQVDSFYALSDEDQEAVKFHISERNYFTSKDVLSLIAEALSSKNESLEERVIRLMPENTKAIWSQLTESAKKSILSQARLYPAEVLMTESQIEHFWLTRKLKTNESVTKKLVAHESLIQEDKLSDNDVTAIMERFKNI
jgi:hypothetical protein